MKATLCLALLVGALSAQTDSLAPASPLSPSDIRHLASQCVPKAPAASVLAIAHVESGYYPLALSVNYPDQAAQSLGMGQGSAVLSRQPANFREALAWTQWFTSRGLSVSIGLMQVSTENLPKLGLSVEDLFDNCTNVRAGWRIFSGHLSQAKAALGSGDQAFRAALSAYNSGSLTEGYANGYVEKALASGVLRSPTVIEPPPVSATIEHENVLQSSKTETPEADPYRAETKVVWKPSTEPWTKKDGSQWTK